PGAAARRRADGGARAGEAAHPHLARQFLGRAVASRGGRARRGSGDRGPSRRGHRLYREAQARLPRTLTPMEEVLVVGGGIGGLMLALMLHRRGISCRVFEAAPELKPLGVLTSEAAFFNRFGQLIYEEKLGRAAGYGWPQISIHRADLHRVLLDAFV